MAELPQRCSEKEAEVDGLLAPGATLWKTREGPKRLLVVSSRAGEGRPGFGTHARQASVPHGVLPQRSLLCVVRQALSMLFEPCAMDRRHGLDHTRVEISAAICHHARVGNIGRQRMLEGVFGVGEEARWS